MRTPFSRTYERLGYHGSRIRVAGEFQPHVRTTSLASTAFTIFRHFGRTFWTVNAVIFLDEVVYIALVPLLPLYAHRFALSDVAVGFLYAAYPLLAFVSSIPAGALTDRLGPRALLLSGLVLFVVATVGFATARSIEVLLLARGLQGFAAGVTAPAGLAAITSAVPVERRGQTLGVTTGLQALSSFVGPLLGAIGAASVGIGPIYAVPALAGAALVIAVTRMPLHAHAPSRSRRPSLRSRFADRDIRASVAFILAIGVGGGAVQTLAPLQLAASGLSVSLVGVLFSASAVVAVGLAPLSGRIADHRGVRLATAVWTVVSVALLLGLALAGQVWVTSLLLVGFLPQIRSGGTLSYMLGARSAAPGGPLGANFGLVIAAWSVGASLGPIVSGYVAQATSRSVAYVFAAAVTGILLIPALTRPRRRCGDNPDLSPERR